MQPPPRTDAASAIRSYALKQRAVIQHHVSQPLFSCLEMHTPLSGPMPSKGSPMPGFEFGGNFAEDLIIALLALLRHADLRVARAAVWEIGQIDGTLLRAEHIDHLTALLFSDDNRVRGSAALVFSQMDPSAAGPAAAGRLLDLMDDSCVDVRAAAVRAVGRLAPCKAKELLCRLRNDESEVVRMAAARALAHITELREASVVMEWLRVSAEFDPAERVKAAASESIGVIADALEKAPAASLGNTESHTLPTVHDPIDCLHRSSAENSHAKAGSSHPAILEKLEKLEQLIRIGVPLPSPEPRWQKMALGTILELKTLIEDGSAISEADRLHLESLKREFYDHLLAFSKNRGDTLRGRGQRHRGIA